jgi:aspartate aminotransferase-like enzyme
MLNDAITQYEQQFVNAEDEYLAMSCGAFNPRFLAMIKRTKAEYKNTKDRRNKKVNIESC